MSRGAAWVQLPWSGAAAAAVWLRRCVVLPTEVHQVDSKVYEAVRWSLCRQKKRPLLLQMNEQAGRQTKGAWQRRR